MNKDDTFPLPPISSTELPARLRIAQFLILPPHQSFGHGTHLYTTIQSKCFTDPTVVELTVEDPNEEFDALRDTADYYILEPEFTKNDVNINADAIDKKQRIRRVPTAALIPVQKLHEIRTSHKIQSTQFAHIVEMFLLSRIPLKNRKKGGANMARLLIRKYRTDNPDERRYYWWRMLVKQRLYKRSRDLLIQLDSSDRVQKLDETVDFVEDGYESSLATFAEREKALQERKKEEYGKGKSKEKEHGTKRKSADASNGEGMAKRSKA